MRNSGQSGQSDAGRRAARAPEVLIANLELEFHVSPIRISNLNFSNRKFFAISCHERRRVYHESRRVRPAPPSACLGLLATSHSSLATAFLIETPRLEFLPTNRQQSHFSFSNRDNTASFHPGFRPAPRPSPPAPAIQVKLGLPRITNYKSPVTSHESRLSRLLHRAPATPNMASRNPSAKEFC